MPGIADIISLLLSVVGGYLLRKATGMGLLTSLFAHSLAMYVLISQAPDDRIVLARIGIAIAVGMVAADLRKKQ